MCYKQDSTLDNYFTPMLSHWNTAEKQQCALCLIKVSSKYYQDCSLTPPPSHTKQLYNSQQPEANFTQSHGSWKGLLRNRVSEGNKEKRGKGADVGKWEGEWIGKGGIQDKKPQKMFTGEEHWEESKDSSRFKMLEEITATWGLFELTDIFISISTLLQIESLHKQCTRSFHIWG